MVMMILLSSPFDAVSSADCNPDKGIVFEMMNPGRMIFAVIN